MFVFVWGFSLCKNAGLIFILHHSTAKKRWWRRTFPCMKLTASVSCVSALTVKNRCPRISWRNIDRNSTLWSQALYFLSLTFYTFYLISSAYCSMLSCIIHQKSPLQIKCQQCQVKMEKCKLADHEVNSIGHFTSVHSVWVERSLINNPEVCLRLSVPPLRHTNAQKGWRVVSFVSWLCPWVNWMSTLRPAGVGQNAVRTVTGTSPWKTSSGTLRSATLKTLTVSLSDFIYFILSNVSVRVKVCL